MFAVAQREGECWLGRCSKVRWGYISYIGFIDIRDCCLFYLTLAMSFLSPLFSLAITRRIMVNGRNSLGKRVARKAFL